MTIAPVLQRFVDGELERTPALIGRVLAGCLRSLRDTPDRRVTATERGHRHALAEALEAQRLAYQTAFIATVQSGVRAALAEHGDEPPVDPPFATDGTVLMDEARVEIDIEIFRAMQLIDTTAEWELRELQTFTSTLVGQTHVSAESNPLRPLVYATALWEAACTVSPLQADRTLLLRVSADVAAGSLKHALAAACTRLEAQGVEPGLYRTRRLAPGSIPGRSPAPAGSAAAGAFASVLASLPAASATGLRLRGDESPNMPRVALHTGEPGPTERQTTELLSRLFRSLLTDPQLPRPFAAVLARLQTSALRIALNDPDLLASTGHPVWHLLDGIGEACAAYPQANDTRAAALLAFCRTLVEPLACHAAPDATVYRRAQTRLDAFLDDQRQTQQRAAQVTLQALQLAERREILEQQLALRLIDQMAPTRTPPGIRRFVTGAWARVLAESMFRDGEQGEATRSYVGLVDDLLWSVQVPDHPPSRQRLIGLLPGLLQRLREGMALIDLPVAEQRGVLDELTAVHSEALRPGGRPEPVPLTPAQIVQRLRDEVLPPQTVPTHFSDSVIDLGPIETVPAAPVPQQPANALGQRFDSLREGDRLHLFLHRRWARVQVLWRSDQGRFFLFASDTPGRTHAVTQRALEKLRSAGLMQPLEARSLVRRALDDVARELARPG